MREGKWETIPPLMEEKLRWADFPTVGVTEKRSSAGVDGNRRRRHGAPVSKGKMNTED
jgi:hypothetical protein